MADLEILLHTRYNILYGNREQRKHKIFPRSAGNTDGIEVVQSVSPKSGYWRTSKHHFGFLSRQAGDCVWNHV